MAEIPIQEKKGRSLLPLILGALALLLALGWCLTRGEDEAPATADTAAVTAPAVVPAAPAPTPTDTAPAPDTGATATPGTRP